MSLIISTKQTISVCDELRCATQKKCGVPKSLSSLNHNA